MDNLDYIESYFTKQLAPEQAREFELKTETDPAFAEEVAFYLSAQHVVNEVSRSEKKQRFKELYQKNPASSLTTKPGSDEEVFPKRTPVRKMIFALAAAAVAAGLIFGIYTVINPVSTKQLADQYIRDNLQTLGVTMSSHADSLQSGLRLYNAGQTQAALQIFEQIASADDSAFDAKKYAGLSALRLKEYEKALGYFKQMEGFQGLYANPALFLQALTLMERNDPGDSSRVKDLLRKIINNNQEGKEEAVDWLHKM